jgi:hypothetical protein
MDKKQLGQEIARQRKAKGMSQWTLAQRDRHKQVGYQLHREWVCASLW